MADMLGIDLKADDWLVVRDILRREVPEFAVWAFGSRVKGTAKAYSDLDLAIMTDTPLSMERLATLKEAFDESDLPFRVDVVDWAVTSPSFRLIIAGEKVVIQSVMQAEVGRAGL